MKRLPMLMLLLLAGCKVGGPSVADKYRIEARDLRLQLDQARADNAELQTKLAQLGAERSTPMSPEAVAALPALARLAIGDYSGLTRETAADNSAIVRIYVQPTDARGRVIQITGTLEASVAAAPDSPPLGIARLGPAQLRDAYRAGFMGVYYTIDVPVPADAIRGAAGLHASVRFVDSLSGAEFAAAALVSATVPAKP